MNELLDNLPDPARQSVLARLQPCVDAWRQNAWRRMLLDANTDNCRRCLAREPFAFLCWMRELLDLQVRCNRLGTGDAGLGTGAALDELALAPL